MIKYISVDMERDELYHFCMSICVYSARAKQVQSIGLDKPNLSSWIYLIKLTRIFYTVKLKISTKMQLDTYLAYLFSRIVQKRLMMLSTAAIIKATKKLVYYPFKRQPYKIVKHTLTICRQKPTNCLSMFDHFGGLVLKGLNRKQIFWYSVIYRGCGTTLTLIKC